MSLQSILSESLLSRPVWGAWIEIGVALTMDGEINVAPRMGRVD